MNHKKLILILGDQLTLNSVALQSSKPEDVVLMAEVKDEASYCQHHKHKIAMIFAAMRHFANRLTALGMTVTYYDLPTTLELGLHSIVDVVKHAQTAHTDCTQLWFNHCGEYRLQQQLAAVNSLPVTICPQPNFFSDLATFSDWAKGKKQLRMEYFYRLIRKQTGILMQADGTPVADKWNFDASNRKPWKGTPEVPKQSQIDIDAETQAVIELVETHFADHPGQLGNFAWPVTHQQAEQHALYFIDHLLANFGDYQDAMHDSEPFMFHGRLSAAINIGLLDPLAVCKQAEQAYLEGKAPLNAVEGFIRQILGWREYVRGIYWHFMPEYQSLNQLEAKQPLPSFFWNGDTQMNCLQQSIRNTLDNAYAHHIQRLMVLGNFALLAGLDPDEVCDWYLSVYADAFEWVELPNTLGMALYGDNGIMASKPYCASGNYINKMSNYCKGCSFNVKTTTEHDSCPFNALYWQFLAQHQNKFSNNPRMAFMMKNLARKSDADKAAIEQRVETIRQELIYPQVP